MVSVFIERTGEKLVKEFSGRISTLLEELNVNPETVVVVKNDHVVSEAAHCKDDDALKLLSVISGG